MKTLTERILYGNLDQEKVKRISDDIFEIRESANALEEELLEYLHEEKRGEDPYCVSIAWNVGHVIDTCRNLLKEITGQSY